MSFLVKIEEEVKIRTFTAVIFFFDCNKTHLALETNSIKL